MPLSTAQLAAIKADILANPALSGQPNNSDGNAAIALVYNAVAAPDYWVWRSDVSRAQIYSDTGDGSSTWNWTTYKNQSATEQNAWVQMFMGDKADFGKVNLRAGVAAIFTGSAQANAQRDHVLSVGRRKATRIEKLLKASGAGTTGDPAVMGFEGPVSGDQVEAARNYTP